jgi:TPR repeat protein
MKKQFKIIALFMLVAAIGLGLYIGGTGHVFEDAKKDPVITDARGAQAQAESYAEGKPGIPKDEEKAAFWRREAVRLYRAEAERGDAKAQMYMARALFTGEGIEKNEVEAASWVLKAAEGGSSRAAGLLGTLYVGGIGVTQSFDDGILWLQKSSDPGARDLATRLAMDKAAADILPPDTRQAKLDEMYAKAASEIRTTFAETLARDKADGN